MRTARLALKGSWPPGDGRRLEFGVSRERVRQLEQRLLARLRDFLKREMGDATDSL